MLLTFDLVRHRYIGERLTVRPEAFDAATHALVQGGMHEHDARAELREEARWCPGNPGVELIRNWPRCSYCRRPLWPVQGPGCEPRCVPWFAIVTRYPAQRRYARKAAVVSSRRAAGASPDPRPVAV